MGTHPIFESDFDCLTDKKRNKMIEAETSENLVDRDTESNNQSTTYKNPIPLSLLFLLLSACIVSVALIIKWISIMPNGFGPDGSNMHFLWMILFVVLTALGTLSFRLFTNTSRLMAKVIHALSLTAAFVIAAMGLNSKWK